MTNSLQVLEDAINEQAEEALAPVREEVNAILRAGERVDQLLSEAEVLRGRCEILERGIAVSEHEITLLRDEFGALKTHHEQTMRELQDRHSRDLQRVQSERDHHMRRHAALAGKMRGVAAALVEAIEASKIEAYERTAPAQLPGMPTGNGGDDDKPPAFLLRQAME